MLLVVVSDPVGIRTRDPQLRRLLLYPAELPDLVGMRLQEETRYTSLACRDSTRKITYVGTQISAYKGNLGAKVLLFFELCK